MTRKYVRKPELVDEAVKASLSKLKTIHGSEFKASTQTILDHVDKRRIAPALPTIKNSLDRLMQEGFVNMDRQGKLRGMFTFSFPKNGRGTKVQTVPVQVETQSADTSTPKRRRSRKTETPIEAAVTTLLNNEENRIEVDAAKLAELVERRDALKSKIQTAIDQLSEEINSYESALNLVGAA